MKGSKPIKILIAIDGSAFSDAAIEKLCRILENAEKTQIEIVSVYEQPVLAVAAPYPVAGGYNPALETKIKELATRAVFDAEEKLRRRFPALKENLTTRVLCGSPGRAIVGEAEIWGADIIVVGSHGYGFWERTFLGSVSGAIVNHAPCSVLVVKKNREENGAER